MSISHLPKFEQIKVQLQSPTPQTVRTKVLGEHENPEVYPNTTRPYHAKTKET